MKRLECSLIAMLFSAAPSFAQTAPDNEDIRKLDPVIVSASRVDTTSDETPVSIDALDAETLSRTDLADASDLARLSASLTTRSIFSASAPQFFIRGVGNNDVNPNANPGIAVYLDDVFVASPVGQNLAFFDLDRAEILKGPQGTLFGRNSTGGTLILKPAKPSNDNSGYIEAQAGEFGLLGVEAAFSPEQIGPVSLRLAGFSRSSDGYTENTLTDGDENDVEAYGARLIAETGDGPLSASLLLDWTANRSGMTAHEGRGVFEPSGFANPLAPQLIPCSPDRVLASQCVNALGYQYTEDPYSEGFDRNDREHVDAGGAALTLEYEGPITFKSITSYRVSDREVFEDTDASPIGLIGLDFINDSEAFTQEVLILGDTDRLNWQAGAFFLSEELSTDNRYDVLGVLRAQGVAFNPDPNAFFFGPYRLVQSYQQDTTSYAVFGEGNYDLTERLTATFGARYTIEETEFDTVTIFNEPIPQPILSPPRSGDVDNDAFTWRLGLNMNWSEGRSTYATISRGFKGASFNGGALFPFDEIGPVEPEFLTAYEIGTNWRVSDTFDVDANAFIYDYTDLQNFTFRAFPPPTRQILDSADATVQGAEIGFRALLPAGFSARGELVYLDAEFDGFTDANGIDRSGNRLTASPEWSTVAQLDWEGDITKDMTLKTGIAADYRSEIFFDNTNDPLLASDSRTLFDAYATLTDEPTGLAFTLSVRNLTDEAEIADVLNIQEFGFLQQTYGPPRQVIFQIRKDF
ncbi:MAG: TonB-dependent receptor [Pseudomonadota bacterium]